MDPEDKCSALPKLLRARDCGINSRLDSNDDPLNIYRRDSSVSIVASKKTRIALQLKQLQEERAIQRRKIEAELRALEQEKSAIREKYRLLGEQLMKRCNYVKRGKAAAVVNPQHSEPKEILPPIDSVKQRTGVGERVRHSSSKVILSMKSTQVDAPFDELLLNGTQQRNDRSFSKTIPNKQQFIVSSDSTATDNNHLSESSESRFYEHTKAAQSARFSCDPNYTSVASVSPTFMASNELNPAPSTRVADGRVGECVEDRVPPKSEPQLLNSDKILPILTIGSFDVSIKLVFCTEEYPEHHALTLASPNNQEPQDENISALYHSPLYIVGQERAIVFESNGFSSGLVLRHRENLLCCCDLRDQGYKRRRPRSKSCRPPRESLSHFGQLYLRNIPQCDRRQSDSRRIIFGSSFVAWIPPDQLIDDMWKYGVLPTVCLISNKHPKIFAWNPRHILCKKVNRKVCNRTVVNPIDIIQDWRCVADNKCGAKSVDDDEGGENVGAVPQWICNSNISKPLLESVIIDKTMVCSELSIEPFEQDSGEIDSHMHSSDYCFDDRANKCMINIRRSNSGCDCNRIPLKRRDFANDADGIKSINTSGVKKLGSLIFLINIICGVAAICWQIMAGRRFCLEDLTQVAITVTDNFHTTCYHFQRFCVPEVGWHSVILVDLIGGKLHDNVGHEGIVQLGIDRNDLLAEFIRVGIQTCPANDNVQVENITLLHRFFGDGDDRCSIDGDQHQQLLVVIQRN